MDETPSINLESLPDWLKNSLDSVLVSPIRKSALGHKSSSAWPMLLDAAVVGPFIPRELAKDLVPQDQRHVAEQVVLEFAEMLQTPEGPKWSLSDVARNQILNAAVQSGEVTNAVCRTKDHFKDLLSQSLQTFLLKDEFELEQTDSKGLEATRLAVKLLSGISGFTLPTVESIESEIQFRRIMVPFERMIGQVHGNSNSDSNRFVGRGDELEDLREYVGVISSRSIRHFIGRAQKAVTRAYYGWRPLSIWGVGGAGKSTLIAKFMVEHGKAAQARFPFAYLDFDRPTISPRNQPGLLAEMCLQTGAQFSELAEPMNQLRSELLKLSGTSDVESISQLHPYLGRFRRHIDEFLSKQGWFIELERPFLLVFDTFELVQYSEDDVIGMERFVEGLGAPNWSRLRLVISGRQVVETFLGEPQKREIGPLDKQSSAELIVCLAADAGKPISSSEASKLIAAVAKVTNEKQGVHPLRLQLVGQLFKSKNDSSDGSAIVRSLLDELRNPSMPKGETAQTFIEGILIRRITEHIGDERVKALANPGLVVRRITPEVIQKVMTPGTPPPASQRGTPPQESSPSQWVVDDQQARDIFEAFRKEVSLVEVVDDKTLRHRDDVRRQMLPSMRASSQFETVNRLAYEYYCSRVKTNRSDFESAEEAVYHGLWLEEPLLDLDRLWPTSMAPRIDPAQFDKGSRASLFVRAKLQKRLTLEEISSLPQEIALEWLDARSTDLLNDHNIQGSIDVIQKAFASRPELLDERAETAAVLACLMYRAGLWEDARELAWRHLQAANPGELAGPSESVLQRASIKGNVSLSQSSPMVSMLRTFSTVIARGSPTDLRLQWIAEVAPSLNDPIARVEVLAHCLLGMRTLHSKSENVVESLNSHLDAAVNAVREKQWNGEQHVLGLAISAGCHKIELLAIWLAASKQVPRGFDLGILSSFILEIIQNESVADVKVDRSESRFERFQQLDEIWRSKKEILINALRENQKARDFFWRLATADYSDWIRPVGNSLTRALKQQLDGELTGILRHGQFLSESSRSRRFYDGVRIAQSASEDGRLLELARLLYGAAPTYTYLNDASEICDALLAWDQPPPKPDHLVRVVLTRGSRIELFNLPDWITVQTDSSFSELTTQDSSSRRRRIDIDCSKEGVLGLEVFPLPFFDNDKQPEPGIIPITRLAQVEMKYWPRGQHQRPMFLICRTQGNRRSFIIQSDGSGTQRIIQVEIEVRGLRLARVPSGAPSPEAKTPPLAFSPFTDADVKRIAAPPAAEQVEEVRKELMRRNPGFDGTLKPTIEKDVVTELSFNTDEIIDIAPVLALARLVYLDCRGTYPNKGKLSDLSPLAGMFLSRLDCSSTQVADLSPLAGLSLTYLHFNHNPVSDLTPLKQMPLLELGLAETKVSDLSPLKGMKLKSLGAQLLPVTDLSPLQGMSLKALDLYHTTGVTNLQPLKGMPLEQLNLQDVPVSDLSALEGMTSLRSLNLGGNALSDLTPLQGLKLTDLIIRDKQVSDLSPLKGMPLARLEIYGTGVSDLRPLQGMELVQARLTPKNITEGLDILRGMQSLKTIGIDGDKVWPAAEFWDRYDKGEFTK